jgi:hypothetical protein
VIPDAGEIQVIIRPPHDSRIVSMKNESYFFLPAMALAGPLRVRALVWVR